MIQPLLLLTALAGGHALQRTSPTYWVVNQITNPGFESSPLTPAWDSAGSYGDPYDEGDPDDFEGVWNGRTTGMHRSGTASFSFGLDYNEGQMFVHSQVAQTLKTPVATSLVATATLYAWSPSGKWSPDTLDIEIDYTDAAPSYYDQEIIDSEYDQTSAKGWQLVDFKSALRVGKTVSRIVLSTDSYPYAHQALFVDDVFFGKKVPFIFL